MPSVLPVAIFLAEMCVVTLGTLRIIFVARGHKFLAPLLGFFEILTWLFAIGQVIHNLDDPACFLAFAAGFTLGSFLGVLIEEKLALGMAAVRVFMRCDPCRLIDGLRAADFGVTCVAGAGASGPVQIVMTVVKRRQLPTVLALVETHAPHAFYAIDELQDVGQGVFPESKSAAKRAFPSAVGLMHRVFHRETVSKLSGHE